MNKIALFTLAFLATGLIIAPHVEASGVTVSPAVLEYNSPPNTDVATQLTIMNAEEQAITIKFSQVDIIRDEAQKTLQFVPSKIPYIKNDLTQVTIAPKTTTTISLVINISEQQLQSTSAAGIQLAIQADEQGFGVKQNMVVPIVAGFTKEVAFDVVLGLTSNPQKLVLTNNFDLFGGIVSRQNRNFTPAGRIDIREGTKLITSIPLTEQLPERLNRDVQANFQVSGASIALQPLTDYQAQLIITDTTTGQIFATTYEFKYIPIELVFLITAAVILIVGMIIFTFVLKRRSIKKRK
jgi:hypothetical protein